jgi:hypothetical protein
VKDEAQLRVLIVNREKDRRKELEHAKHTIDVDNPLSKGHEVVENVVSGMKKVEGAFVHSLLGPNFSPNADFYRILDTTVVRTGSETGRYPIRGFLRVSYHPTPSFLGSYPWSLVVFRGKLPIAPGWGTPSARNFLAPNSGDT